MKNTAKCYISEGHFRTKDKIQKFFDTFFNTKV